MSAVHIIKGVLFSLVLYFSATFGAIWIGGCSVCLLFFRPSLFRFCYDFFLSMWELLATAMAEILIGAQIVITGDLIRPDERNMIIMNHRTRIDWMFFWSVLARESGLATEKIVLKAPLKKIPGPGWAMQLGMFIFLNRRWENDKHSLKNYIDYFSSMNHETQVLFFPEGTDFTAYTKTRSDQFAMKNNLTPYEYVLHPRTTGFSYLVNYMKTKSHIDAVYDVTVGYPRGMIQNEGDIIKGNFPREVHFHIKRYAVQSLPVGEAGLSQWCMKRWQEKEENLKLFYQHGKFNDTVSSADKDVTSSSHNAPLGDSNDADTTTATKTTAKTTTTAVPNDAMTQDSIASIRRQNDVRVRRQQLIVSVVWLAFICTVAYWTYFSGFMQCWTVVVVALFYFMTHKFGGFDCFQCQYSGFQHRSQSPAADTAADSAAPHENKTKVD